jgi:membrane protein DedA with SNARE-associated domain
VENVIRFLTQYGYVVLLAWVLVEQPGFPLPAGPMLLAAGALAGRGTFQLGSALAVSVSACVLSDVFWFHMGRRGGGKVLNFICRISLEPDSCVRRTSNTIAKYGPKSLLVTKFVPGLNAVAAPLAGSGGMGLPKFVFFDFLGSLLWCGSFLGLGYLFRGELENIALFLGQFNWLLGLALLVVIPAGYIAFKHRQRQKFIREISMERIEPEELLKRIDAGEQVTIVDLRHPLESLMAHTVLPNAIRIPPEELEQRHHEIPRDREVVLYCT